jgi:uncharacterized repeat protein (TIGR03803 family)
MRLLRIWPLGATFLTWSLAAVCAQGDLEFKSLLSFDGTNGSNPKGELLQGHDARLYGTAVKGGSNGLGMVFALSLDGSGFTVLHSFAGGTDGANPSAGLIQSQDGSFYGTALNGGTNDSGTVFRITAGGAFTTIAFLSTNTGAHPDSTLALDRDGSLYGTADMYGAYSKPTYPGSYGYGSIFHVTTQPNLEALVLFANTNGDSPRGGLVQAKDGDFYGTTLWGGKRLLPPYQISFGDIFRFSPDGTLTTLYQFTGGVDGGWPYAGLVQGQDGGFYGVTFSGGTTNGGFGTVFRITDQGQFAKIHTFTSYDGANPYAGLIQASDGNLYGTTYVGGPRNAGTIFQISTNGDYTGLHAFSETDGLYPLGRLVQADNGNFYGTTASGGAYGLGTIFRLSLPSAPVLQSIVWSGGGVSFTWTSIPGRSYQVQYTPDLTKPNWTSFGPPLVASSDTLSALDSTPSDQQRWYRVLLLP